jgi:hypothetical protein
VHHQRCASVPYELSILRPEQADDIVAYILSLKEK